MSSSTNFSSRAILFCLVGILFVGSGVARGEERGASAERRSLRLVVLPVDNLSGSMAPIKELRQELVRRLKEVGGELVDQGALERTMARNRLRYCGGVDSKMARVLREELQADAVVITTLEMYLTTPVPRLALTCRIVSTEALPEIIWIDSVARSGDEHPGFLGLGMINEMDKLRSVVLDRLIDQLVQWNGAGGGSSKIARTFRPKLFFNGMPSTSGAKKRVVVMPFSNKTDKRYAGEITLLHFVRELTKSGAVSVLEPGVVRERMLAVRTVMLDGFTYRDMDLVAGEMPIDIFVSGKVYDYVEGALVPKVNLSVLAVDKVGRKTLWASNSYNDGEDAVHFFDIGRITTASSLTETMVHAIVNAMLHGS